ncbi:hypothetical protein GJ744_003627 [Endocarpon pusillum]|uniref:Uncharacterized protein n=1 Tax=Endocarpon pusillum TaxID=364733 RepID=A0A8H7A9R2_9EURO|nr:hypothetical protein GJ744_003627 [Endocarpon pusillum]
MVIVVGDWEANVVVVMHVNESREILPKTCLVEANVVVMMHVMKSREIFAQDLFGGSKCGSDDARDEKSRDLAQDLFGDSGSRIWSIQV